MKRIKRWLESNKIIIEACGFIIVPALALIFASIQSYSSMEQAVLQRESMKLSSPPLISARKGDDGNIVFMNGGGYIGNIEYEYIHFIEVWSGDGTDSTPVCGLVASFVRPVELDHQFDKFEFASVFIENNLSKFDGLNKGMKNISGFGGALLSSYIKLAVSDINGRNFDYVFYNSESMDVRRVPRSLWLEAEVIKTKMIERNLILDWSVGSAEVVWNMASSPHQGNCSVIGAPTSPENRDALGFWRPR